jgi:hypothetical protein
LMPELLSSFARLQMPAQPKTALNSKRKLRHRRAAPKGLTAWFSTPTGRPSQLISGDG